MRDFLYTVKSYIICLLFILYASLFFSSLHGKDFSNSITFFCDTYSSLEDQFFKKKIGKLFFVDSITYESDINFIAEDFFYIIGFKEKTVVSAREIKKALSFLFEKKKFKSIQLFIESSSSGKKIHFVFKSVWTVNTVAVQGVFFDRDKYIDSYLLDVADEFNESKHEQSLKDIKKQLHIKGYLEAAVTAAIAKDFANKLVSIVIVINKGPCFVITDVNLRPYGVENSLLKEVINSQSEYVKKKLINSFYDKKTIKKQAKNIKNILKKIGYLYCKVFIKTFVDFNEKKIAIVFDVKCNNQIKIFFKGNNYFSDKKLFDKMAQFKNKNWVIPDSILIEEVTNMYKKKGFWFATVSVKRNSDNETTFSIKEADRIKITNILLPGINYFSKKKIINNCCLPLLKKKYFDEDLLQKTLHSLVDFYQKKGFLDVKVINYSIEKNDNNYQLKIFIDEGVKRHLSGVRFNSCKELEELGFFERINKNKKKKILYLSELKKQEKFIKNYFKKKGFLYTQAQYEILPLSCSQNVEILWNIDKGVGPFVFGKTIINGNTFMSYDLLETVLNYKEGDLWDQNKLKKTVVKLRSLDSFSYIHMHCLNDSFLEKKRNIILQLHEDVPFELRLRSGFGLQQVDKNFIFCRGFIYSVGGVFLAKNISSIADQVGTVFNFARFNREFSVYYKRPWIFKKLLNLKVKGYINRYDQPGYVGSKNSLYTVGQAGFLIGFSKMHKSFNSECTFGFEYNKTTIKENTKTILLNIAKAINISSQLLAKQIPYFFSENTLFLDLLDSRLNPKKGFFTLLSLKLMVPLSSSYDHAYLCKILAEQSLYIPIKELVLAFRFRLGHIFYRAFESIMPFERFYLGGANSLRGYESDLAPPLGVFLDEKGVTRLVPRGGKTMINATMELRFPFYRPLQMVFFQDLGFLFGKKMSKINAKNILLSTGFGLRYSTPIGPVRFDIGWNHYNGKEDIKPYAWCLTLGHIF